MSKSKKGKEDFKQEDVLQAVLIADSFNVRFAPVTQSKPRALLPLVNVPLIEYTLECLATSGIEQVILFCCIHADQIKRYIDCSRWSSPTCTMEVVIVVSETCMSVGDALREIDAKSLIATDFVLINGDMISNVHLKPLLEAHKQRRLREKTPVMTMLCKKAPPGHVTRCREEDIIMAIDRDKDRVLHYEKVNNSKKFNFPVELFDSKTEVSLRFDLLDTHISICSPIVPTLFTDNFDYLTRDDFIKGILDNEEILGNTIHTHILQEEYAARVSNLFMYEAISADVMNRWSYPLVPDRNISQARDDKYRLGRHNIYLHSDVTLARGCILEENVVIGRGSCVGSNTKISHSVIGKNVRIGENVQITGAFIWDDCVIGDDCRLMKCVVDTNVNLKDNVTVNSGCVLASNVVVGPCVVLDSGTSLVATLPDDGFGDDDDDQTNTVDVSLVGSEGVAYRYVAEVESDEEEIENITHDIWGVTIQSEEENGSESSVSDEDSMPEEAGGARDEPMEGDSLTGEQDEEGGESESSDEEDEDSQMFYQEVVSTLERGITDNIAKDNLILEINSAKSAYGIYIKEVNLVLTKAVLMLPFQQKQDLGVAEYFSLLKTKLTEILPVVRNYIRSRESQTDCLLSMQDCCTSEPVILKSLMRIVNYLYDEEVIEEQVIINWYDAESTGKKKDKITAVKQDPQLVKFIQWLREADEESESD